MELRQLRIFTAIVDAGSLTAASAQLNLTQPALSAALKALEQELGQPLFDRVRNRLMLTETGARFYHRAQAILRECDAAKAEIASQEAKPFRLGLLTSFPARGAAEFVSRLRRLYPEQTVHLSQGTVAELSRLLHSGRLDAALTLHPEQTDLPARLLWTEPLQALVPVGHRFARQGRVKLADLDREPFVIRRRCELRQATHAIVRRDGIVPMVTARATEDALALALVENGLGVTLGPPRLVAAHDGVVAVSVTGLDLAYRVSLVTTPGVDTAFATTIGDILRSIFQG